MNKREVVAFVLTPGEYKTRISKVSATDTAIRIHFLTYALDGQPEDDVYENFDFRGIDRKDALVKKVTEVLRINDKEFAEHFDAEALSEVAAKLESKLAGIEVTINVAGTMIYHTCDDDNQPRVFTKHVVEWR